MNPKKQIRCLIIEDEPMAQELLMDWVEQTPSLHLVGTAMNAQQALDQTQELKPDLLFLDIRMPKIMGFELLKKLPESAPLVVVTSAYREYAITGFDHAVVDFLEKPIYFDRFSLAIKRVEERLAWTSRKEDEPGDDITLNQKLLTVRSERNVINVRLEDLIYIESLENYVKIHQATQQYKTVVAKATILEMEKKLPAQHFMRIHRKYLVRLDQVQVYKGKTVQLFSGEELLIGVTFRENVKSALESC